MIRASVKALEEIKRSQHVSPSFHEYALQWESTYSESKERLFAYSAFEEAWSTKTISLRTLCQIEELAGMSWKQLFGIVCWGILNADLYEEHTDSAAFMAAEIHHLAQFDKSLTESKSMKKAKAYMLYFSEEMHSWFDYNDSLQDPIIPKSACNCRCLPRHVKHCPTPRILQDDGGWCEAKPKRKRNTKNTSKSKSSTLGVAASGPS
jgi:hypothetical protein